MGWSETYKPRGQPLKDFFKDEFSYGDHPEAGLIDLATAGWNLAHAAVRHPKGYVFAATIQIRYSRGYYNIRYRIDDESVGPNHRTCPQRILDQLTPDDEVINKHGWQPDGYWKEWRDRCRAHLAGKETRSRVRDGDIIRFENPPHLHRRQPGRHVRTQAPTHLPRRHQHPLHQHHPRRPRQHPRRVRPLPHHPLARALLPRHRPRTPHIGKAVDKTRLILALEALGLSAPYGLNEAAPRIARAQARHPRATYQDLERCPAGPPIPLDAPPRRHGFLSERINYDQKQAATYLENLYPDLSPFISAAEDTPTRVYRNSLTAGLGDDII